MWPLRDRTSIVGIGETEYWKAGGATRTEFELACQAVMRAVEDAGLSLADVDGLSVYSGERSDPTDVAQTLGLRDLRYVSLYPGGGNSACAVVHHAAIAVAAGTADVVVCYRSICQGQFGRFGRARVGTGTARAAVGRTVGGRNAFTMPIGLMSAAQNYALEARRHMYEFGTRSEHFGMVSVACYANAQRNPRAVMYGRPLTLEDHQRSRMIADPYRLFDCCQESDGACAVVVTTTERARDLRRRPVLIAGAAEGLPAGDGGDRFRRPLELWTSAGLAGVARDLYDRGHRRRANLRELHRAGAHGDRGFRVLRERRGRAVRGGRHVAVAARRPADQHGRRQPRGGVHPRAQSRERGRAPAPR
ncbi:MAG: lipid-transfer protein [Deltaproteobacteria bacterium]|nr:MAG: lipid-transfer protein [Deltaproteobacteria bacterium]